MSSPTADPYSLALPTSLPAPAAALGGHAPEPHRISLVVPRVGMQQRPLVLRDHLRQRVPERLQPCHQARRRCRGRLDHRPPSSSALTESRGPTYQRSRCPCPAAPPPGCRRRYGPNRLRAIPSGPLSTGRSSRPPRRRVGIEHLAEGVDELVLAFPSVAYSRVARGVFLETAPPASSLGPPCAAPPRGAPRAPTRRPRAPLPGRARKVARSRARHRGGVRMVAAVLRHVAFDADGAQRANTGCLAIHSAAPRRAPARPEAPPATPR